MADSRRRDSGDNHHDRSNDADDVSDSSSIESRPVSSSFVENATAGSLRDEIENEPARIESRLSDPVADVLAAERDGDFLLGEGRVLRWLQALDMQVLGACRGDERLKPLLKLNVSNGMAEDRLLSHLSQHFEPAEIGMLARCFCIPLVSVRVGKIKKEGTRMRPTTLRGSLSLMVLPTSDLRLSFTGDNGQSEQLFTYTNKSQCSAVSIEDITADSSGRSFVIRIADGHAFYYWCSEKSKLLGTELRRKMKDLIMKKPSISELTGIEESRLGSVASHLRLYLMGSVVPNIKGFPIPTTSFSPDSSSSGSSDSADSSSASKSLRARNSGTQVTKASSFHQGSLSPRSSSFKENTLRSSPLRISSKSRRRSEGHFLAFDNLSVASNTNNVEGYIQSEGETADENRSGPIIASDVAAEFTPSTMAGPQFPLGAPVFSPYYCWCPPNTSSLHAPSSTSYQFPPLSIELPSLPPLSSLLPLPASGSDGFLIPSSPLDLSDIPPFLPNSLPLVHLPISSSSQQMISTFTPLMCDPIVHIPVIDICSSGQAYLVSAGPGISTSIPPLLPQLVSPVGLPQNDSLVEKGARETLRLLISGANSTTAAPMNQGILVAGSRGLYSGTRDMGGGGPRMSLFAPLGLHPAGITRTGDGGSGDGRVDGGESGASSGEAMHVPPRESSG